MAFGITGAPEKQRKLFCGLIGLCLALAVGAVRAQTAAMDPSTGVQVVSPPEVAPPDMARISPVCDAPFVDIATPTPLPQLAQTLERKQQIRVLAIGSSSTVGVGSSNPAHNYPNQLGGILKKNFADLDLKIINKGVSGEVSAQTAERMRRLVLMEKPTLVLWQVGTNDALARVPADDFRATVSETIRWLKSHEIDVVLVGLQYTPHVARDEHYHAVRKALSDISAEERVLLVRRFAAMEFLARVKGQPLLAPDELHLNDLGYRCMAEHIARSMVVSMFLRRKPRPVLGQ